MHGVDLYFHVFERISKQKDRSLQDALAKGVRVWKAYWQVK